MTGTMKAVDPPSPIPREDIQVVADHIAQMFNPQKIMLFGSYARGTVHPFSDVDLLVVLEHDAPGRDLELEVVLSVPHPFPMDLLVRSPQEIVNRLRMGDTFFQEIMEQGVMLYERPGE
jgi:predicted nucleotidyltransferase